MGREFADDESDNLAELDELLRNSDLPAKRRRAVHDAIVSSRLEGVTPDRNSLMRLIAFAAGRINFDKYRRQARATHTATGDREAIDDELRLADADYAAGNAISGEALRERYGLR